MRGKRPNLSNSFASIGVDSLGAVMFIKYLSDSVGGIRIEPSKIYAPGVTIRLVAVQILLIESKSISVCGKWNYFCRFISFVQTHFQLSTFVSFYDLFLFNFDFLLITFSIY